MNTEYYKKFEPVFNSWYIKRMIGEGSYGKVFEIEREDFGTTYKAALKAMTIPSSESEIKSVMADGMDEASVRDYYENFVEDIVKEFVLMSKLKGNSNIVSYEDHMVIEHKNEIGWDILIRMELLTPLFDHIKKIDLRRKDVIQLGIDMCKALELCQKYNIIHRDIKPENIFVSENGDYKLGDFGIARTLEQTSGMLSKKGTQAYMAPEIYREESYGSNVDIYSLGIVMYRLLNENRTPFLPAYPAPITHADRESAIKKRISGASLPTPSNADGRLAEIVLKACRYNPKERYFSPMEMREELEAILYNKEEAKIIYPKGDETPIKSLRYVKTGDEIPNVKPENRTEGMLEVQKTEGFDSKDSTGKTEGMFGRKATSSEKTESEFDSRLSKDEKTEGMFGTRKKNSAAKKKSIWQNWITYVSAAAIILVIAGGSYFIINREPSVVSCSVQKVEELTEPIEFQFKDEQISDNDMNIIIKRLEAYGCSYFVDKETGKIALDKKDLGKTNQEILATVHMLTGLGEIKIADANNADNVIDVGSIENATYISNEKDNCSYMSLKLKQDAVKILEDSTDTAFYLYVDDNIRCNNIIYNSDEKELLIKGGYDGKKYIAFNPFEMTVKAEQNDNTELSANYIRLLISIINEGKLSKSYEVIIDEKYGIVVEENTEIPEEETLPTEEPETEPTVEPEPEPQQTKPSSNKIPSNNQSTSKKPQSTQQPAQQPVQQPVQQQQPQPSTQQPVQQAPAQTQPQQPSQQQPQEAPPIVMGWD